MANKGLIFDIKRFAIHDGDGLRTTIFFKGCPLKCRWCQNPEGIAYKSQLIYLSSRCMGCQSCVEVCPKHALSFNDGVVISREKCDLCGKCIDKCPTNSLKLNGVWYQLEELVEYLKRDDLFYHTSNGGITFSGGEVFAQFPFVLQLAKELKKLDYHLTIETSFYTKPEYIEELMPYLDHLYVDIKLMDKDLHQKYCGVDNALILDNIKKFACDKMIIRVPLIPSITDSKDNLMKIKNFVQENGLSVECLNYNPLAAGKYNLIDEDYSLKELKPLDDLVFKEICEFFY